MYGQYNFQRSGGGGGSFPWGAAITAGAGLLGSGMQAWQARRNVERTNQANMKLAKYQFEKDKEMWHLMNEYNAPSAQMARFKEAGLNPNLMYGMGTPGNVGEYPQFQAPHLDYRGQPSLAGSAIQGATEGLYEGINELQEMDLMKENIEQAQVQTFIDKETSADDIRDVNLSVLTKAIEEKVAKFNWEEYQSKGIQTNDMIWFRMLAVTAKEAADFAGANWEEWKNYIKQQINNLLPDININLNQMLENPMEPSKWMNQE